MTENLPQHVIKSFDEDLRRLRDMIARMGGLAERQVADSTYALTRRDPQLAAIVAERDAEIDQLQRDVEAFAIRLLALRQPVAADLRFIVGALKIAGDLERIGDYAKNNAKRAGLLAHLPQIGSLNGFLRLARLVQENLKEAIDALVAGDATRAKRVWAADAPIDEITNGIFREMLTHMMGRPARHHPLHPHAVHRQEPRAHRRPRDQHRRSGVLRRPRRYPAGIPPARRRRRRGEGLHPRRLRPAMADITSAARPTVLVVEDEAPLMTLLRYNLERQGFRVDEASDGQEALLRVAESKPDLVLLDWMLPSLSGIEVCRQLRRKPATRDLPIIMLTARTEDQDQVRALDIGADDYVTKPFAMEGLIARIRALLRRSGAMPSKGTLSFHGLVMDQDAHRVTRNGRSIHLGPTEYRLLEFFLTHPGRVFSREQLLDAVWGRDIHVEPRTVDVHIRRLRKALNGEGEPDLIRTVRSAGYALDAPHA